MDRKILFTDLDGTLLSSDKTISPGNLRAIGQMTKAGHMLVIATGRPLASAIKIARRYGWTEKGYYISSFNGGLIYDCGEAKTIVRRSVSFADVRFIFDKAYEAGLHCHTYSEDRVVAERLTPELKFYSKAIDLPDRIEKDVTKALKEEPPKIIVLSFGSHEVLDPFRAEMASHLGDRLLHFFSHPYMLEFLHPESSKGQAIKTLCDVLGIPVEQSIAAGDEENDVTMIKAAGTGVCMANGVPASKAVADYVTESDNDHDGIKEVIERFVLTS
ncbi:MAG: HAD family phosphatase [Lachnospiraceae bacterium]|nr:HAD family phosphatase [Lachnospiraceae bacterium]